MLALLAAPRAAPDGRLHACADKGPRRVFLDLGASWANTLRRHIDLEPWVVDNVWRQGKSPWPRAQRAWEVVAFEANPMIKPFVEEYTEFLNGHRSAPPLPTIPPFGSSDHLAKYAVAQGCCTPRLVKHAPSRGVLNSSRPCFSLTHDNPPHELRSEMAPGAHHCCKLNGTATCCDFRECMADVYAVPHRRIVDAHLTPGPLDAPELAQQRLAEAARPHCGHRPRYTFVPAAASNVSASMRASISTCAFFRLGRDLPPGQCATVAQFPVPLADFASWLKASFTEEDTVIAKFDIEGAEFAVLETLMATGGLSVIDALGLECHNTASGRGPLACGKLTKRLASHGVTMIPSLLWEGFDSYSTPSRAPVADPTSTGRLIYGEDGV